MVIEKLQEAWKEYCRAWGSGYEVGNKAMEQIRIATKVPSDGPLRLWLYQTEMLEKAWAMQHEGYQLRVRANNAFGQIVLALLGEDVGATWTWVEEKKLFRCTLSTGEVLEP